MTTAKTVRLTEAQRWVLLNALNKEARACRECLPRFTAAETDQTIRATLERQISEYESLADLIEEREVIELR